MYCALSSPPMASTAVSIERSRNVDSYMPPVATVATSSGRSFTTAVACCTAQTATASKSMLPSRCCSLEGVCAVPGTGGRPNVPGGVAWMGPDCRGWERSAAEFLLASGVPCLSDDDDYASAGRRAVTQHAHRRGKRIVQTCATGSLPQTSYRLLDLVVVPVERQQVFDVIVVTENCGVTRWANNCLCEHNRGLLDGRQKRRDARAGLENQHGGERFPAEVKGFDFLRDAVVEHVEIILLKVQDQFALGVVYSDRRVYQRDLQANRALRRLLHRRAWFGRDGSLRTLRARVLTGNQDRRDEHDKASCK